jgi:hypothetical protein
MGPAQEERRYARFIAVDRCRGIAVCRSGDIAELTIELQWLTVVGCDCAAGEERTYYEGRREHAGIAVTHAAPFTAFLYW